MLTHFKFSNEMGQKLFNSYHIIISISYTHLECKKGVPWSLGVHVLFCIHGFLAINQPPENQSEMHPKV